ncbi:DUF3667 domain-containing protein [Hephaestia mangrovi]|uniref:DUF3667 domain-containing protein n=1 Tax=Hephaestia mangrovi TaxID=2873268 RepID=UPI001CA6DD88|nr:DUF3667 domain-containing protein [Hephaestia mangrovi]MBY8828621.1 DUF3667 domain-containing protein [Hephaestia mangrovi]
MTGGFEAAGDIATGAFMGRSVEPRAGEHVHGADGHGACLNCGAALIGEFCHECGQNGHVHKTLASIGHDLLHGVFHFEGKIWRTLPMLVIRPGELTRRYIAGERAKFVSPLALYLFAVFLMFAVIHSVAGEFDGEGLTSTNRAAAVEKLDTQIGNAKSALAKAQAAQTSAKTAAKRADAADDVKALTMTISGLETAREGLKSDADEKAVTIADIKTGWAPLDHGIAKANANPGLAIYKLQMSAYKYSWVLIPISAPLVALLFLWRRRYHLYDHTIFVIYSLDFMTLLVTVLTLLGAIGVGSGVISITAMLVPPVHIYKQLRGAYQLRRFSAFWRMCVLVILAFVALTLFVMLLLGLGLMG